jgi:hypothetical protein
MLLSHLHHLKLLNIPYFLLESLKLMANFVHQSKHPQTCVMNHDISKILVNHALEQQDRTWIEFINRVETNVSTEEEEKSTNEKFGKGGDTKLEEFHVDTVANMELEEEYVVGGDTKRNPSQK